MEFAVDHMIRLNAHKQEKYSVTTDFLTTSKGIGLPRPSSTCHINNEDLIPVVRCSQVQQLLSLTPQYSDMSRFTEDIQSTNQSLSLGSHSFNIDNVFNQFYASKVVPPSHYKPAEISPLLEPSKNPISDSNSASNVLTTIVSSETSSSAPNASLTSHINQNDGKLDNKSTSINISCNVTEILLYVEKGNVVEKFELVGTLTGAVTCIRVANMRNEFLTPVASASAAAVVALAVDITDAKAVFKSILLNKSLQCSKAPVVQEKYQQVCVRWTDTAAHAHLSGSSSNGGGNSVTVLSDYCPTTPTTIPILRYTCIESYRPTVMKARYVASRSDAHTITFIAQVNLNPKFANMMRDFKIHASIAALLHGQAVKNVSFGEDVTCVGEFQTATKMLSWTIPNVNGNEQPKLTFQASVVLVAAINGEAEGAQTNSFPIVMTEQVPLMVKAVYCGVLLSSVDMDVQSAAVTPSGNASSTSLSSGSGGEELTSVDAVTQRNTAVECRFL